jgi:hypothetical protein
MRRPILNHTLPSEPLYDCFLGSGTTLVGAEQTGRIAIFGDLAVFGIGGDFVAALELRWREDPPAVAAKPFTPYEWRCLIPTDTVGPVT